LFDEFSLFVIAWCFFALVCGGLIKGTLGVGTPLLTVPLMALVLPVQMAVTLMAIRVVVANLWQVSRAKHLRPSAGRFWPAFLAILLGTYVGVMVLSTIDERSLLMLVGFIVIAFTLLQASSYRFSIPPTREKPAGFVFGLSSGVIGGVSSMFGPMLIIYLVSVTNLDKDRFVGAISFLYIAAVVPWAVILYWFGILDSRMLVLSMAATLPVVAGMVIGQKLRVQVSDRHFHHLVLAVLLVSGGVMLWRAFG